MDEILKIFGAAPSNEAPPPPANSGRSLLEQLPGGGGVWEFESTDVDQLRQNSVYNVPPPVGDPSGYNDPAEGYPQQEQFSVPGGVPLSEVHVEEATIEGYLTKVGAPFEKIDDGLWMVKYAGGAKDYEMFIELTQDALRIVMPVLERVREVCREKVWYHLLRMNYTVDSVNFSLNKRDEIFMGTQIPIRYITYEDFKKSFANMCTMMDDVYPELLFLAQKQTAVSSFLQPNQE